MDMITEQQHEVVEQYLKGQISQKQTVDAIGVGESKLNDLIRQLHAAWLDGEPFVDAEDWRKRVVAQWKLFLDYWPLERLKTMTVEEYAVGNHRCSFCYWLEHGTKAFAGISGRSGARMYECWFRDGSEKHEHAEVSFESLRSLIVSVAQAAAEKDMSLLAELSKKDRRCGLWPQVFWKIALLYQPIETPFLRPFLSKRDDTEDAEYPERQVQFEKSLQATGANYWNYSYSLMFKDKTAMVIENNRTVEQVNDILGILKNRKNIILQGAPGTGKTWIVPEIVTRLCEKVREGASVTREDVMKAYKELLAEGRVCFTTFHPSLDYDDFVEGWKPGAGGDPRDEQDTKPEEVSPLHVEEGIFRLVCDAARDAAGEGEDESLADDDFGISDQATVWKVSLYGRGENPVRTDCLKNNRIRVGWPDAGQDVEAFIQKKQNGSGVLDDYYHAMKVGDVVVSCFSARTTDAIGIVESDVEWHPELGDDPRVRRVKWLWKGAPVDIHDILQARMVQRTVYRLWRFPVEKVRQFLRDRLEQEQRSSGKGMKVAASNGTTEAPACVLVIDEINRGNIAKIFGELITLLEADKREGEACEQTVTLPYSKEKFSVPSNVYVIGTMNTADRSIGTIDYALRRRFSFYQVKAQKLERDDFQQNLFDHVREIFYETQEDGSERPNRKYLSAEFRPEDVMPGHSYFLAHDGDEAQRRFTYELKPLLEEYLYDGILMPVAREKIEALKP